MYRTAGVSAVCGATSCCSHTRWNIVFIDVRFLACGRYASFLFHIHRVEPAPLVSGRAAEQPEECTLKLFCDRPALGGLKHYANHRADWSDLRGGAREKQFIRQIQHLARHRDLAHVDALLA